MPGRRSATGTSSVRAGDGWAGLGRGFSLKSASTTLRPKTQPFPWLIALCSWLLAAPSPIPLTSSLQPPCPPASSDAHLPAQTPTPISCRCLVDAR